MSFVKYLNGTQLLLFINYFVKISKHLNKSDLQTKFNIFHLITNQLITMCDDYSFHLNLSSDQEISDHDHNNNTKETQSDDQ